MINVMKRNRETSLYSRSASSDALHPYTASFSSLPALVSHWEDDTLRNVTVCSIKYGYLNITSIFDMAETAPGQLSFVRDRPTASR
jgi:hypothetical protein